jgi:hypothetical protein
MFMKKLLLCATASLIAGSVLAADADTRAEVKAAAQKLADKSNYSWTSTSRSEGGNANWRQGPLEGQTEKGGFTYCKVTINDNEIETAFKGAGAAIKREVAWESAEELEGNNAWIARQLRAFKPPAQDAEDFLNKAKPLKKGDDGLYSADLTEEGAKEFFSRRRRGQGTATNTKGWVKFWVKDGLLTKYEFNVQGKIPANDDQREIEINRTTTVEIKDVDSTKVSVPEAAKKKLS